MTANISKGSTFRKAIKNNQPLQIVGTINAYTSILAEKSGHRAIYLSGGGVAASSLGVPDLGITTLQDVLVDVERITSTTKLPLLVDADTGWGGAFNISRMVKSMISAGAAAIHIEDQVEQKRCGHRPNKELVSSIYKKPVDGEVEITKNGIIGDKQADLRVHGGFEKAVYAYSYSHYKSWSEQMGEDYSNDYGLVGENLTIDDFDEKNLFIGDEVTISNCILKITQPRIPCFKLGIKMNNRKFPKLFSQSGNVGAYMKVLTPGKISKGDEITITRQESSSMTVYEIMYLLYKDLQNTDQMKRALKISSLTEDIKEKFRERLLKLGDYSSL